jgi:hypothetical protein
LSDRSGAKPADWDFAGDGEAAGIGGDNTHGSGLVYRRITFFLPISLDLHLSFSEVAAG